MRSLARLSNASESGSIENCSAHDGFWLGPLPAPVPAALIDARLVEPSTRSRT
jgi:hypothetical protein